jgi:phage tail sheath protein FI
LPPSIKSAGIYTYTDTYFHTWDAPAGIRRGKLQNIVDVAYSPTNEEAGKIYSQCWNYAINYPLEGPVLEGQKTMQIQRTAFDRVNVRRLFLHLEKRVIAISKYFTYEGNTEYLRQRFVDTIRPIFEEAVAGGGISQYYIRCDNTNNTP